MILSLFLFFLTSGIILLSTIGYGLITTKLLKLENLNYNFGLIGILGLFFLSIIASFTHLFVPHNYVHNILIILFGFASLIFLDKKKFEKLKYILIVFVLLFICILIAKTNEDFGYYHLPNSIQFAQQKLQFGLGNLNHGFKHISSIFMLMSLNYLPFFEFYLVNLTNYLFLIFFVIFILVEIYLKQKKNLNLSNIILCTFLILFLSKFSRLAEYGSDISGQIVIAFYFFYLLEFFYNNKIKFNEKITYLKISGILITFAITLKFISVIYATLLFAFFLLIKKKKEIFIKLIKINYLIIIFLSLIMFIFLNFSATGCLIYPVEKLCFSEKFDWTLNSETVKYLNFHYEVWSKGGKGPDFGVTDQQNYIILLNWVPNWLKVYFFGKFTDYILVTFAIILVINLIYFKEIFSKKNKKIKRNKKYSTFYYFLIIIFLLWFFNFPTLRYAGYIIIFLLFIFPYSIFVENKIDLSKKNFLKKISIIFLISYSIFLTKNISRLSYELNLKNNEHHNFKDFPFFWVNDRDFKKIKLNGHDLYLTDGSCWSIPSTCIRDKKSIKVYKKNNYIFYLKK